MKHISSLLVLGIVSLACWTQGAPDLSKLPPGSDKKDVTYAKDIKPLLDATCVRCHGAEKPKAGLSLVSLESILKGGKEGKAVVPGKSTESQLVISAAQIDEKSAMPPKRMGRPLTAEQVGLIRAWIDQGAK